MLRVILPIVFALSVIVGCVIYLTYDSSINSGEYDVEYNETVYVRGDLGYNLRLYEDNSKYSGGDYRVIVEYGQEVLLKVRVLNDQENVLYSALHVWLKPGYELPDAFGEEFSTAEYLVSEGLDERVEADLYYTESATSLAAFDNSVKLEDIVESEPRGVTLSDEAIEECNEIRFKYKNHADIALILAICNYEGDYYLGVRTSEGNHEWFKINPEYVDLLTSAIPNA